MCKEDPSFVRHLLQKAFSNPSFIISNTYNLAMEHLIADKSIPFLLIQSSHVLAIGLSRTRQGE